ARIEWLAARLPFFGLGADIIAGFAGEADTDHAATRALVEALPFTYLHVFPFSVRPDAPAARLGGRVAPQVVSARARELRGRGAGGAVPLLGPGGRHHRGLRGRAGPGPGGAARPRRAAALPLPAGVPVWRPACRPGGGVGGGRRAQGRGRARPEVAGLGDRKAL